MLRRIRDSLVNLITSRFFILIVLLLIMGIILIHRLFVLQIIDGEKYLNEFTLTIKKERTIPSTRGNIYDYKGELLAYNELAYNVTIEDVYESGKNKNKDLNHTISSLIDMIEENGDSINNDFNIIINSNGEFEFSVTGSAQQRFLADIYGKAKIDDLAYGEKTSNADDIINYLAGTKKYELGEYEDPDNKDSFKIGQGYSKQKLLQMVTIRYEMSLKSFQKYIPTIVASDISEQTVAIVMENAKNLDGVNIAEDTIRKYVDSYYFSHIIGYTGKISQTELESLSESDDTYSLTDVVGKAGIENYMESYLQGSKGTETVYVNNLGKVIESSDRNEPSAGQDVYLTIDKNLQKATYNLLEQKIAGILVKQIRNIKEYIPAPNATSSSIVIPIDDVYYALINNSIIDIGEFSKNNATELEKFVYSKFENKQADVFATLNSQMQENPIIYSNLDTEYKIYNSFISSMLAEDGIIDVSLIDVNDETYKAWRTDESISLKDYLMHVIAMNWVDVTKLELDNKYSDSAEIYLAICKYTFEELEHSNSFQKKIYKYMIRDNSLTGKEVCLLLFDQKVINGTQAERATVANGTISPYNFMLSKISNLEITPAQLALDPCSGSVVITDVNTGEIRALVTYPGYDNNRLANSVDAEYYARLNSDLSKPLWNYATQQLSAPGSTYKMVSAATALQEEVVTLNETISCKGIWDSLPSYSPRCWIYPSSHGPLNVVGAIENSCNYYFYEIGYRLSKDNGNFDVNVGLSKLNNYADLFGLSEKSGIEITEESPKLSDTDPVRSAIGQGSNNFTTVGLSRYVTTVANSGTCFNLSLLDKVTDVNGNLLKEFTPTVRNMVDMPNGTWNAIHQGMRKVVENKSYYSSMEVKIAGKTGTAQESSSRPNHALFVSYAPYENPEISVSTRIAFGYTSDYAAQLTQDVYKYYYHLEDEDVLINGTATSVTGAVTNQD